MDYQKELKKVEEGGNFWSPKPGQFKVKSLTEIEITDPFVKKHEDKEDEVTEQFKLTINVGGEEKTWTFGKGKTPASTYGQLIGLATKRNNTLKDVEFSVVVTNDGVKNNYTIVE